MFSTKARFSAALVTAAIAASFYLGCSAGGGVESSEEGLSTESLEELTASVTQEAMQRVLANEEEPGLPAAEQANAGETESQTIDKRAPRDCDCGGGTCCCNVDIPAPWDIRITSCCNRVSCVTFEFVV
jgi:hypothetical protein